MNIRERFFRLSLRERLIAVVLLLGVGIFWASSMLSGYRALMERNQRASAELEFQKTVLSREDSVEEEIASRLERMEAQRTLTASSFVEAVDQFSRGVGLRPDMDPVETMSGEMVSVHRLELYFDNVAIVPLIDFIRRLENDGIPVSIDSMLLSVNERSPERLDVSLRLDGFEFNTGPTGLASAP
ncbi:hypothetical protein [Puniceicoccus vermicola]|uniref:Type II secretion system protein M n=1 Tax=Puniceicoccus vermicola TaxID=388746 RepID=A0A7X1B002_9BACT|nr:hypothetical protein [Puniceicoccus vermicola]MBC2603106.1 hypothetical protein [Puniceicoccus vermicola]